MVLQHQIVTWGVKNVRKNYRSLPAKRPIILFLRAIGGGYWLPKWIKPYLVFEGPLDVVLEKKG